MSGPAGRLTTRFCCVVYADNVILAAPPDQLVHMYCELTQSLLAYDLAGAQPARTLAVVQCLPWLGHSLSYASDWADFYDRGFAADSVMECQSKASV